MIGVPADRKAIDCIVIVIVVVFVDDMVFPADAARP